MPRFMQEVSRIEEAALVDDDDSAIYGYAWQEGRFREHGIADREAYCVKKSDDFTQGTA
jgi:hypothetical protein